jgi:hypothetical protein
MNYPSVKSRKIIMKIKKAAGILPVIFALCLCVPGQKTLVIADPTIVLKEPLKATSAEEKLIKSLLPKVRRIWNDESCSEDFSVNGSAIGAFTKQNVVQKAFLYQFCETGNGLANDGIVITESGKPVAHFVYEGASTGGLNSLPDINGNGIDELLITNYGGMHQGVSGVGVDVIEFSGKSFREIGATEIEYIEETEKGESGYSYKISVKSGAQPVFYREKFVKKGKMWRKIGAISKAEMFKLDYKYNPVK